LALLPAEFPLKTQKGKDLSPCVFYFILLLLEDCTLLSFLSLKDFAALLSFFQNGTEGR
jgi:hypothetical protein